MTKRSWKESMKPFGSHVDPEKEEQLKWIKIEIENKVKRIAKLIKKINQGSREGNLRRRSELLQLVDEFHQQYQSLYSMYDNLRGEVRKKLHEEHEGDSSSQSSSSCSNSESYFSPEEVTAKSSSSCSNCEPLEDAILKDKIITSNFEVKETVENFDVENFETPMSYSRGSESGEFFKDLCIQGDEKLIHESEWLNDKVKEKEDEILYLTDDFELREKERLSHIKGLEDQVASMKVELDNLCVQKRELEEKLVCKSKELKKMEERNLVLEATFIEKDDQFSHLLKEFDENQLNSTSRIDDLMAKSNSLQQEVDRLNAERHELEQKLLDETKKGSDQVKDLLEQTHFSELQYINGPLHQEVDRLRAERNELEQKLLHETKKGSEQIKDLPEKIRFSELEKKSHEASDQVKDLTERTNYLQQELEALRNQNSELELSLKEKTQEVSECHLRIENMKEKLTSTTLSEKGLKSEVKSLAKEKCNMEEKIMDMNQEAYHSELQKEKLNDKIMELETKLLGKDAEVGILQKKHEAYMNDMSTQSSTLTARISNTQKQIQIAEKEKQEFSQSIMQMEKKNTELTIKIAEQEKIIRGMQDVVNKSKEEHKKMQIKVEDSKANFHNAERKLEEMTEELRKTFEDSLRILSRRIRVAEQLHVENKEWYQKTRNSYEKENKDLKEKNATHEMGLRGVKDISLTASDMLGSLDAVALKFEECTGHFLNRISKVSCELQFVKDWVMRKNKAMAHVRDDFDCLLAQCDDKEAEILKYREKVWKSDNKVRELEKMIKDKEESMLVLKEEKREAIRQLCVWIDYHRSRSDYYKRILLTEFGRRSAP
ncbi:COP1-interactive protein 1-like [Lycium ferocissimum]|uniref:COP1-interactive protein 1-like n=1 Tax=Lycium ferocissimum TaxID=112874 RepID=UPI002816318A|nr:COP1-interactive protein 1-like [Lycium ferocissimum]